MIEQAGRMVADYGRIRLPAGALLFAEGDIGTTAFLVMHGKLDIFLAREAGEILLAQRGPGEIVGEMALMDTRSRSASVRVAEDCELVLITADQLRHRICDTDPILRMCLGVVIERYREMVAILDGGDRRRGSRENPNRRADFKAAIEALSVESELRRAVADREFEIHYQPIVRLSSERLAGFEALVRWRHPERGLLLPGSFIGLAEASGLISDITQFCIEEVGRTLPALTQAALSNVAYVDPLFVSINVSGHDLSDEKFVPALEAMLTRTGMSPASLKLEVTESVLMKNPRQAVATLESCRSLGFEIALDDFGTGYSSLSYLATLPIDTIKIDRSFVHSMGAEAPSRKIITMILGLAEQLAIPAVGEGIEEDHQSASLNEGGCAFGQGYLYGRPASLPESLELTRTWKRQDRRGSCRKYTQSGGLSSRR